VRQATAEPDPIVRQAPPDVSKLRKQLCDADAEKARRAADELASLGAHAAPALPELVDLLQKKECDGAVRCAAVKALGSIGREAAKTLDPEAKAKAVSVLINLIKDNASVPTSPLVRDPNLRKPENWLQIEPPPQFDLSKDLEDALVNYGEAAVPDLCKLLQPTESKPQQAEPNRPRKDKEGPRQEDSSILVPKKKPGTAVPEDRVRIQAASILARIGPRAAVAVESLKKVLRDRNPQLVIEALHALAGIGPKATSAEDAINEVLKQPPSVELPLQFEIQKAAKEALKSICGR
jgi:HEAT repeat protein